VWHTQELRSLQPDVIKLDPSCLVRFVAVDGLGKIVLSNINTPKVGGWMNAWIDAWMDGWRDGGMDGGMEGWRDGWRDGGMDGWMDAWMDGCMDC
jgi:hypothetical protein